MSEERMSVGEHLMREHGLIHRIILASKESVKGLKAHPGHLDILRGAAEMNQEYVHTHHEEYEEHEIYPMFSEDKKLHHLSEIMDEQHKVGKLITEEILSITSTQTSLGDDKIAHLSDLVHQFERMYVPHAAMEDTLMWPALHKMKGYAEYMKLGSQMEKMEIEMFGEGKFEELLSRMEKLEQQLGIHELGKFTASPPQEMEHKAA